MIAASGYPALSIKPTWAHAILHLGKNIENRSWTTRYRGIFYNHASARDGSGDRRALAEMGYDLTGSDVICGAIVGSARIVDIVPVDRVMPTNLWALGPFCWLLEDVRALRDPIVMPGRLGLWRPHPTDE